MGKSKIVVDFDGVSTTITPNTLEAKSKTIAVLWGDYSREELLEMFQISHRTLRRWAAKARKINPKWCPIR